MWWSDGTWTSPANPDKCEKEGAPELGDGGGGAALPVDLAVAVTATACGQDNRAGNIASVTFDITSVANPQEFPEVTLVVTYPASVTGASLSCTTVVELNMELGENSHMGDVPQGEGARETHSLPGREETALVLGVGRAWGLRNAGYHLLSAPAVSVDTAHM